MSMRFPRVLCAGLLGLAAAVLVSCGGSGKGLIPTQDAGPLQSDFEAVAQAAQSGNGSCTQTATAIRKTQQDFAALPPTVDHGLRQTLESGISNLRSRALTVCAQPIPPVEATATVSSSTESSSSTSTDTQTVETTSTQSTPSNTATTTTPPGPGGGTQAPGEGNPNPGTGTPGEGNQGNGTPGTGGAGQ